MGSAFSKTVRLFFCCLFLLGAQRAAPYTYPDGRVSLFGPQFFKLPPFAPYDESNTTGVQASGGQIFGVSGSLVGSGGGGKQAFYYDPKLRQMIGLPHAGAGNGTGEANAISSNGIKVGYSFYKEGVDTFGGATFWGTDNIPHLLSEGVTAYAVTPDGSVVAGVIAEGTGESHRSRAAIWSLPGGALTPLPGLPGYDSSEAWAISADGKIIAGPAYDTGPGRDPDKKRAVRWVLGQAPEDLGDLLGCSSPRVTAMSSDGTTVVGLCNDSKGEVGSFSWTRQAGMTLLDSEALARAVSGDGKVVVGATKESFSFEALQWKAGERPMFVRTLLLDRGITVDDAFHLTSGTGISQDGQTVCGFGADVTNDKSQGWVAVLPDFLYPPVVSSPGTRTAVPGEIFLLDIQATNKPTKFSVKGLPKGFHIDGTSGTITGIWSTDEAKPGIYTVTVSATNGDGTGKASFLLELTPPKGFHEAIHGQGYLPNTGAPGEELSNRSFGNGVSADGTVGVGQDGVANEARAYHWSNEGGMSALPRHEGALRNFSTALAVSADGKTVVGQAAAPPAEDGTNRSVATVWKPSDNKAKAVRTQRNFDESATAPVFTPINIGLFPGGIISLAEAVSADGTVVAGYGDAKDPDPNYIHQVYQAFRWAEAEGMQGLGFLPGGLKLSQAFGISADGTTIVGASDSAQGYQAFRWTQAEGLVGLGKVPGATESNAKAISADKSAIIGVSSFSNDVEDNRAFRWTADEGMIDLGVLSGDHSSEARAVSADGSIVVGHSSLGSTSRAFLWDKVNGMRDLKSVILANNPDFADWKLGIATGISADGTIITGVGTNPNGDTEAFMAYLRIRAPQLLNIATRIRVSTGENVLIGGFIITGTQAKKVIIRGIGPSLEDFGVQGVLADPTLELHQGSTTLLSNNDWKEHQAEIQATTIPPSHDLESAIVATLSPGSYTAILADKNGATGVGVVEVYDLDQAAASRLANISSRGFVETGQNVMIGGVIVGGGTPIGTGMVLVRGVGPSLTSIGITGALEDPTLGLFNGNGTSIASNDDWQETQKTQIEATSIPPSDDRESAILATLPAGSYTAVLSGKNGQTGVAVVEAYNLP